MCRTFVVNVRRQVRHVRHATADQPFAHRVGYELDFERIVEHAKANGCLFEINSSPNRLDLSDEHARLVKEAGMKIAVNTDAHGVGELGFINAGINQSRRGWLTKADVLNAQPLRTMLRWLRR